MQGVFLSSSKQDISGDSGEWYFRLLIFTQTQAVGPGGDVTAISLREKEEKKLSRRKKAEELYFNLLKSSGNFTYDQV
jgi:hypothetical protein